MQEQMTKTQAELEKQTIEVSAGGGKVKVTANGAGDIIAIKIDREVVDPDDVEFLEEVILSGVKQAVDEWTPINTNLCANSLGQQWARIHKTIRSHSSLGRLKFRITPTREFVIRR